jgi:hypothetical protein
VPYAIICVLILCICRGFLIILPEILIVNTWLSVISYYHYHHHIIISYFSSHSYTFWPTTVNIPSALPSVPHRTPSWSVLLERTHCTKCLTFGCFRSAFILHSDRSMPVRIRFFTYWNRITDFPNGYRTFVVYRQTILIQFLSPGMQHRAAW